MERNTGIRRYLLRASVYQGAQRALGADKSSRRLAAEVLGSTPQTVVIDIGCGTADIADYIEFREYIGFDPNPPYVEQAAKRLGRRATILLGGVGDQSVESQLPARADLVVMMGVLHHLDDETAHQSLRLASRLASDGGRFVGFDPGFVEGQPRVARFLASRDRGQHVRTPQQTLDLLNANFAQCEVSVHHDFLRIPYTHLVAHASGASCSVAV